MEQLNTTSFFEKIRRSSTTIFILFMSVIMFSQAGMSAHAANDGKAADDIRGMNEIDRKSVFRGTPLYSNTGDLTCELNSSPGAIISVAGDLNAKNVPEPMRSQIITASQKYNVPPAAVAALYLTEQNGFTLYYRYFDNKFDTSVFTNLTPTSSEWQLDRYGTTGVWETTTSKFRGAFQFGPIWESKYHIDANGDGVENIYDFADQVDAAAHYMADLGATSDKGPEGIREAARQYNGQVSFELEGGSIRNPDPAKFPKVQNLYAEQVVLIAAAISGDGGTAPATQVLSTNSSVKVQAAVANNTTKIIATAAAESSTAATSLTGSDNVEKAFRYLLNKGLTPIQVAAVIGNLMQESGPALNPKIIQGGALAPDDYTPKNGVGFGLAQWTFTARQKPLTDFAKSKNLPVNDMSVQLDFLWNELTGDYKSTLEKLKAATDIIEATVVFHDGFEGSADSDSFVRTKRGGNAKEVFSKYGTLSATSGTAAGCEGSKSSTIGFGSATSLPGNDTRIVDNFLVYMQCDTAWGDDDIFGKGGGDTMCSSSCGPTSMAIILKNFGVDVDPTQATSYARSVGAINPGVGSTATILAPKLAEHWGVRAEPIKLGDIAGMKDAIGKGALIVVSGKGAAPYTSGGHYVVIRSVTPSGKFKIADPNSRVTNAKNNEIEWDSSSTLFTNMHNQPYAIYKK